MNDTTRLRIGEINKNLMCTLCRGYLIDATTIIECIHSFCRTCIVTYLKTSKTCPVCDTVVHKTRPHQNIRSDKLLQDLVYKIVPGLYKDEMRRRREFYTCHYDAAPKRPGEERGDEMSDRFAYTEEENISLALHLCPDGSGVRSDSRRIFTAKEDLKTRLENRIKEAVDVRYLQCKAAVTIGHMKKFVRFKYGLPSHFQVDMFYNDEPLRNGCTLCDVAYFFNWRRRAPMVLTFCVFEPPGKCPQRSEALSLKSCTSVTSESMTKMDITADIVPAASLSVETSSGPDGSKSCGLAPDQSSAAPSPVTAVFANGSSESKKLKQSNSTVNSENCKSGSFSNMSNSPRASSGAIRKSKKIKSRCAVKRPSTTPVPIAPAPAKVPATRTSGFNISKLLNLNTASEESCEKLSNAPKLVSLLPIGLSQMAVPAPVKTTSDKSLPAISFSVSSILGAAESKSGVVLPSSGQKPSWVSLTAASATNLSPVTLTATRFPVHSSSTLSSPPLSCQSNSKKSKRLVPVTTSKSPQNELPRHLQTSSVSSSTSTVAQSSHASSVGSPTPAASASPTPAAVPVHQSQTQGSDVLQPRPVVVVVVNRPNTSSDTKATYEKLTTNATDCQAPGIVSRTCSSPSGETDTTCTVTSTLVSAQSTNKASHSSPLVTSDSVRTVHETKSTTISSSPGEPQAEKATFSSLDSSTSFPSEPQGDLINSSSSSVRPRVASSSPSSSSIPKQSKQKKIADIANTLQKRVNDALLSMVSRRASCPSHRSPSQSTSPGTKTSNLDIPHATANRNELAHTPAGHPIVLSRERSLHRHGLSDSAKSDEPLNLVKRDKEFIRVTNGLFIFEVPHSAV